MFNIKHKGFTLTEIIIVLAILGILTAIAIPMFGKFVSQASETDFDAVAQTLQQVTRTELRDLDQRTDIDYDQVANGSNTYNTIFENAQLDSSVDNLFIYSYNINEPLPISTVESTTSANEGKTTWVIYLPNNTTDTTATPTSNFNLDFTYPIKIFAIQSGLPTEVFVDGVNSTSSYVE